VVVAADAGPLEPFEEVLESPTIITAVPLAAVTSVPLAADAGVEPEASAEPDASVEPVKPKRTRRTKLPDPSDPAAEPPSSDSSAA
jgi:hypothetical protein